MIKCFAESGLKRGKDHVLQERASFFKVIVHKHNISVYWLPRGHTIIIMTQNVHTNSSTTAQPKVLGAWEGRLSFNLWKTNKKWTLYLGSAWFVHPSLQSDKVCVEPFSQLIEKG